MSVQIDSSDLKTLIRLRKSIDTKLSDSSGIPIFRISSTMRKANWFELSGRCEKSGVKLQCLTGEEKLGCDRIIGNFEIQRAQEIDINRAIYTRKNKTHLSLDMS